jgi:hypothetical protein
MMRDLKSDLGATLALNPAAVAATITGPAIDRQGYSGVLFIVAAGAVTDGTLTPKLQDSDDNVTFADVAASNLNGSFADITGGSDNTIQRVGYVGEKRYSRLVISATGATSGGILSGTAVLGAPALRPVA